MLLERTHLGRRVERLRGRSLGVEIAAALALEVDGRSVRVNWREVSVGMSEPGRILGGPFAVDSVAWLCFAEPSTSPRHVVILRDCFALPTPGESELKVEESPGVRVTFAGLSGGQPNLDSRWRADAHPTLGPGYRLEVEVDPAVAIAGDVCRAIDAGRSRGSAWPWIVALALLFGGVAAIAYRRRRSRPLSAGGASPPRSRS